jgi:predicted ATP-binding protein involved in virulence
MYIKELKLENFRGFPELTLEFSHNLAVLIGINGSGKSSILDAIAILLSQFEKALQKSKQRLERLKLTEDDINIDSNFTKISIKGFIDSDNFEISESMNRSKSSASSIPKNLDYLDSSQSWPVMVYYQTHRMVLSSEYKKIKTSPKSPLSRDRQLSGYRGAFSSKVNDFQDFFNWFKDEEDYENEIRLRSDTNYRNPNLEIVRVAITKFLNNFPHTKFANLHVVRVSTNRDNISPSNPSLTISKNGQYLKLEKLSDGEKMLLMLVTDLARRLAILNPAVREPGQALEGKGIVLIDEIDLHLHPQWQRIVISSLTETFPNCQFIVTTHSPQVLSHVYRENVFILNNAQVVKVTPPTFGRDHNSILYELMGVTERPIEVQQKLDKCFKLIDDEKIEEAQTALAKLADLLGDDDPEIVRAYTLIDFFN